MFTHCWKLKTTFDLVTVGHFAIDYIYSPKATSAEPTLGGPPTYVSVAAAKLDARVSVISKVGEDFSKDYMEWLELNNVDLSGFKQVENALTTRFVLKYGSDWKRKLWLKALAPPVLAGDVPYSLRAQAVHVAPIANELSEGIITKLRASTNILSLDPQGFVRRFNKQGKMSLKGWREQSVLKHVDVYKSSQEEIRKIVPKKADLKRSAETIRNLGVKIVIVTRGARGASLLFDNTFYNIPSCKSRVVLDSTGAGDAFIGAFLAEYIRGKDPLWSACVGSASASFVVEGLGPQRFGEREETYSRAREIYAKMT